ncbi:MAG TPA: DegT/DnrJ/EryC1/StrS family aminotransferase [Acidimicrobiia bacterium]|nr:DegT/DnrJ/EryC1/StrS family aminotransferase [Acidimicrobiia bacterium]
MKSRPAILGGDPLFDPALPFTRPTTEDAGPILERVRAALDSGQLTDGPLVRTLEEETAESFGVAHCVAVSSCTVGLMLVIQALDPQGPVLVPSFTFSATAHAVRWNGREVAFADCDPATWCLRPEDLTGDPALVIGVHVSGVPCDVVSLEEAASRAGAALIFDAAHGAGSLVKTGAGTTPLGRYGAAEVFSLTPTKVLSGVEGGLITTGDASLAEHLRIARNYGNPGDYDTRFPGLNARLSEPHAAVALAGLEHLEERVERRNAIAARYRERLNHLPGLEWQAVPSGTRSSMKDLSVLVDPAAFGCGPGALVMALGAEGVATRRYYAPPVHRQTAYRDVITAELPTTDRISARVVSLPIWSHMEMDVVDRVCAAIERIHLHAEAVASSGG